MSEIEFIPLPQVDWRNDNLYITTTPLGGDYTTCPICDNMTEYDLDKYEKYTMDKKLKYNNEYLDICMNCNIYFTIGCTYECNGCTSDNYNAHFIKEYKDITTGVIYKTMPKVQNSSNIEVVSLYCPNNEAYGVGYYPVLSKNNLNYYERCELITDLEKIYNYCKFTNKHFEHKRINTFYVTNEFIYYLLDINSLKKLIENKINLFNKIKLTNTEYNKINFKYKIKLTTGENFQFNNLSEFEKYQGFKYIENKISNIKELEIIPEII